MASRVIAELWAENQGWTIDQAHKFIDKLMELAELKERQGDMAAWEKTVEQVVNEVDNELGVNWDTDAVLILLSGFIQANATEADFEKYVRHVAAEDLAELAASSSDGPEMEDDPHRIPHLIPRDQYPCY